MKGYVEERASMLGRYIVETGSTIRKTAKVFGLSKSTVHGDVSSRLQKQNPALYKEVRAVLDKNKAERHIRGGMATKLKYAKEK
ncbi:MAG: sporulation transcriptional regulator SpoIIID [Oscillospiraceae bacterium]|nr:sporulation transcriptional regulator SpoIIID [Oscillospiraceae bacterium]